MRNKATRTALLRIIQERPGSTRDELWGLVRQELPALSLAALVGSLNYLNSCKQVRVETGQYYVAEEETDA
jgi:hypothetical protein